MMAMPTPTPSAVRVVRVREEIILNQETIPFETQLVPLEDVEIDNFMVTQVGQVEGRPFRFQRWLAGELDGCRAGGYGREQGGEYGRYAAKSGYLHHRITSGQK